MTFFSFLIFFYMNGYICSINMHHIKKLILFRKRQKFVFYKAQFVKHMRGTTGADLLVTRYFLRVESMFTESLESVVVFQVLSRWIGKISYMLNISPPRLCIRTVAPPTWKPSCVGLSTFSVTLPILSNTVNVLKNFPSCPVSVPGLHLQTGRLH